MHDTGETIGVVARDDADVDATQAAQRRGRPLGTHDRDDDADADTRGRGHRGVQKKTSQGSDRFARSSELTIAR